MSDKNAVKRATAWNLVNKARHLEHQRRHDWRRQGIQEPTRPMPKGCEICGSPPSGRDTVLQNDHEHLTGEFRGWLCNNCNMAIGLLKDSPELCEKVAQYLRRTQCN